MKELVYFYERPLLKVGSKLSKEGELPLIFFIGPSITYKEYEGLHQMIEGLGTEKLEERMEGHYTPPRNECLGGPASQYRSTFYEKGFVSYGFKDTPGLSVLVGGEAEYQCPGYEGRVGIVSKPYISTANYLLNSEPNVAKEDPKRKELEEVLKKKILDFFVEKKVVK